MNIEKKFPRDPLVYSEIPELPVYQPTTAEFKQPINLIRKLKELGFDKIGAIKIIPPKSWNPEFSFNQSDKKLTTRIQLLRELCKGIVNPLLKPYNRPLIRMSMPLLKRSSKS